MGKVAPSWRWESVGQKQLDGEGENTCNLPELYRWASMGMDIGGVRACMAPEFYVFLDVGVSGTAVCAWDRASLQCVVMAGETESCGSVVQLQGCRRGY